MEVPPCFRGKLEEKTIGEGIFKAQCNYRTQRVCVLALEKEYLDLKSPTFSKHENMKIAFKFVNYHWKL